MHSAKAIRVPIAAILLFLVLALVLRSLLQIELVDAGTSSRRAADLAYLVVPPILFMFLLPILRQQREFLENQFALRELTGAAIATAIIIGVLLRVAYWSQLLGLAALRVYRDDDELPAGPLVGFLCPPSADLALYLLVMALFVPIIEETLHRGFLLYGLLHRGRTVAISLSALLFAMFHPPSTWPVTFLIGLFLAVYALRAGLLTAVDFLCLNVVWHPPPPSGGQAAVGVAFLLAGAGAVIAAVHLMRRAHPPR